MPNKTETVKKQQTTHNCMLLKIECKREQIPSHFTEPGMNRSQAPRNTFVAFGEFTVNGCRYRQQIILPQPEFIQGLLRFHGHNDDGQSVFSNRKEYTYIYSYYSFRILFKYRLNINKKASSHANKINMLLMAGLLKLVLI